MGRLGVVAAPRRSWRAYAGPAAVLVAATIAVVLVRGEIGQTGGGGSSVPAQVARPSAKPKPKAKPKHVYVVRAGDTVDAIAAKLHVPAARLLRLNPGLTPTALFIGEKIRVR
jgi:LysM repeat protein